MNRALDGARLSAYGGAYFFASGAFMSYWPVWLRDRGITDAEIGTLFMSRQLVGVVAMLGMGMVAHRIGGVRGMLLALAGAAIVMMGAYQLSYTFLALLLVGLLWGCIWSPTMALYDGLLVNEAKARGFVYGTLRVWSSVAFIAGTVVCGLAVDRFGPPSVLFVGWLGIACLLPFALLLPRRQTSTSRRLCSNSPRTNAMREWRLELTSLVLKRDWPSRKSDSPKLKPRLNKRDSTCSV